MPYISTYYSSIEDIYSSSSPSPLGDYIDCRLDLETGRTTCHYKKKITRTDDLDGHNDDLYLKDDFHDDNGFDDFYFDFDECLHCIMCASNHEHQIGTNLISKSSRAVMIFQPDGNLCIYKNIGESARSGLWLANWCALSRENQSELGHQLFNLFLNDKGELSLKFQNGTEYWVSHTADALRDDNNTVRSYLRINTDGNLCTYVNNICAWCSHECSGKHIENEFCSKNDNGDYLVSSGIQKSNVLVTWINLARYRFNFLCNNQSLFPGSALVSKDGLAAMVYQLDGNLCIYDYAGSVYVDPFYSHPMWIPVFFIKILYNNVYIR